MKHYYSKYYALMLSLILVASLLLIGCNRSATEGILPDDSTVEEVVVDEMSDSDTSMEDSDSSMQALLDDDIDETTNTNEEQQDAENTTVEQSDSDGETTPETTVVDELEESADSATMTQEDPVTENSEATAETIVGAGPGTYTVQSGDWVYKIARMFNITPIALLQANPVIGANQQVYPGQELVIPGANQPEISIEEQAPLENNTPIENNTVEDENATSIMAPANALSSDTYEVNAGDTMFSISQKLGVSVDALSAANDISEPFMIYVGQTLVVPSE